MRDLIKSVSKFSISIGINFFSSLLRNKILALAIGPIGLGVYSQVMSLSALLSALLPVGTLGLVRYISDYYGSDKKEEIAYIIKHFFIRNLILSVIVSMIVLIFRKSISSILFSGSDFSSLLVILSIIIPLILVLNIIDIYFKSIQEINKYVLFLSVNSLVSLICTIPLIYFMGIEGAILAFLLTVILNIGVGVFILKRNNLLLNFNIKKIVENSVIKKIYQLGVAGLVSLIIQNVTFLFVRSVVADELSLADVGVFQCVYSLSAGYFGIFFTLMGNYSIPKISSLRSDETINHELNSTITFLLILYIPLITFMFFGRTIIIPLLYSSEFTDAKYLLIYQLPAELFRAFSWVMGLWLIPKLKIKKWITFEIVFYSLFSLLSFILISIFDFGLESISISYLISYIIFFLINFINVSKGIAFRLSNRNTRVIVVSVIVLLISFMLSYNYELLSYYLYVPIMIIWGVLVITRDDMLKAKFIISQKVNKNRLSND